MARSPITHDTVLLTFALPDTEKPLNLSTCACILAKFDADGEAIVRPYTPVSTNAMIGKFQLVIKVYSGGKMTQHMNNMAIGEALDFKHIPKNVKIQYPFGKQKLTMLAGGTGITPMIQALHAILGTSGDTTEVALILGNKTAQDILCKDLIDDWAAKSGGRLRVTHVLSEAGSDSAWQGAKGFITRDLIAEHSALPSEDVLVVVCGPPPMYNALCGPRDQEELTGTLAEMGYSKEQVFKF